MAELVDPKLSEHLMIDSVPVESWTSIGELIGEIIGPSHSLAHAIQNQIERRKCPERGCHGDVISVWDAELCLSCGVGLDPPQAASSSLGGSSLLVAYEEE